MAGAMPLSASQLLQQNADAFKAAHWTNGTANGLTPAQNIAAAAAPAGMPASSVGYTPNGGGMWGAVQQAVNAQNTPSGLGGGTVQKQDSQTPTPNTGGQMPPQSTGYAPPKFDAAGIAASRVAAQRAALAGSVNAYDTSRTAAYKYAQGTTQGNRALLQFDNSNRGDQFGGSAREDLFRLQRSQGIEDTAANQAYQNDLAASDAKLAAFDAGSAGMQQDLQQQLEQQQFQNNVAQAPLTGQFNGQQTQQAQAQGFNQNLQTNQFNQQAQNQQFNQGISQAGITGQYNGQPTLAGQASALNNTQVMAQLTGKMPDGTPTNAAQQQQLANQWTLAEQTGTIPNSLADFYGLPHGMQTQAAKTQAAQLGISQQNANNTARSTTASINNMNADNTRADNAVKLSTDQRNFAGDVQNELSQAKSKNDVVNFFSANAGEITKQLGPDGFTKMKNDALAQYDKVTPSDKQDSTIREKAIAAAQKDFRWDAKGTDKNALIKEYEGYYQ